MVPMTLCSFIDVRPPASRGADCTLMCTTVSTSCPAITLAITGLRSGVPEQAEHPGQFFRQQLIAECIGEVEAFQSGLDRLRDAGEAEIIQVAIEQGENLVTAGAFHDHRPAQRGGEQFEGAGPQFGCELAARQQQT